MLILKMPIKQRLEYANAYKHSDMLRETLQSQHRACLLNSSPKIPVKV